MSNNKNLYEILGVDKNATLQDMKKAYRDKAKKAHSDKGGNDTDMAEINKAYSILRIPSKREFYDRTGETEDTPFDKKFQAFINEVFVGHILKRAADVEHEDLIKLFRTYIDNFIIHQEENRKSLNSEIEKLLKVINRTKSKKNNIINLVIEANISQLKHGVAMCDDNIKFAKDAYDHLQDYNYEFTERPKKKVTFSRPSIFDNNEEIQKAMENFHREFYKNRP